MKSFTFCIALLFLMTSITLAQSENGNRVAYTYLNAYFEPAIIEQLDKSKLSTKEEKLYKKFKKRINEKTVIFFENYITEHLKQEGFTMMPLDAVGVMGNSALNMEGYPYILFPKKTLKKNTDKNVADLFISASISVNKPLVAITGMKPGVTVTLKKFNKMGEMMEKVTSIHKTEKKISNIGFAVKQSESFSKIDLEHMDILFSKVEETIVIALDDALDQLLNTGELSEK